MPHEHQWLPEPDDLPALIGPDDLHRSQPFRTIFDRDLSRLVNEVVQPFQRDLHKIALRIIGDAEQRQPLRSHVIAERQSRDLDLSLLAEKPFRRAICACTVVSWFNPLPSWPTTFLTSRRPYRKKQQRRAPS